MAKDLDPKTSAPAQIAEAVAEPAPELSIKALAQAIKSELGPELGPEFGEMYKEYRRQGEEAASKALAGKPEEASKPDVANVYQPRTAAEWAKALGVNLQPQREVQDSAFKSLVKGAAYMMIAKGDAYRGLEMAKRDGVADKSLSVMSKAMGIDDYSAGGALLAPEVFSEVVPELLSETALFSDGAIQKIPVNGELKSPYEVSGPTPAWVAENAGTNASDMSFETMILRPEQVDVFVAVSRKMLSSVPAAMSIVETSMKRKVADAIDTKLIRGDGTLNTPMGLRYKAQSANVLAVNATVNAANTVTDLVRLQQALQAANVPFNSAVARYAISPRSWRYLFALRGTDAYLFQPEMLQGRLLGVPIAGQSGRGISNIPENLAVTDTSESEIYFYSTPHLKLGVSTDMRMEMSTEASYTNSSGTTVSAFRNDQAVFKLVTGIDLGCLYRGYEVAVLKDVDWGV